MWTQTLRFALRSLRRHRGTVALNVVGLAVGLACGLLIVQYVAHEASFDAFHQDADALYRLTQTRAETGQDPETGAGGGYALAPLLAELPGVAGTARIHETGPVILAHPDAPGDATQETDAFWVDPEFLSLFSFPVVRGGGGVVEPGTVWLSETTAARTFGDVDPVGEVLTVTAWRTPRDLRVAGVFADVPETSHLQFELLLPMADLLADPMYADDEAGWTWYNFSTYVQLRDGASPTTVGDQITAAFLSREGEWLRENGQSASLALQPLRDVYLDETVTSYHAAAGSTRTVRVLGLIGAITLLIALINYVNLATARAAGRAAEVGVRKAIGAQRGQLMAQFLAESALVNGVAFALALGLVAALQPVVGEIAGADLSASWAAPGFWGVAGGVFLASTLLAGFYPALVLSSFQPVRALRGRVRSGSAGLRRGLVVTQFAATAVLVVGMVVMYTQLDYVRDLDVGLDLDRVVTVSAPSILPEGTEPEVALERLKRALAAMPGIEAVASSHTVPGAGYNMSTSTVLREGDDEASAIEGSMTEVDADFPALYGLDVVAGEAFSARAAQASDEGLLMLSEQATRALGYATPAEVVGERVIVGGPPRRVVGVFRDVRWTSAHGPQPNAFLRYVPAGREVSVRVSGAALPETLAGIEATYRRLFPGNPFRTAFADAQYAELYAADQRSASLIALFAGLAVGIACLGLLGLSAYTAEQRRKELGVRKVLGATVAMLLVLLLKDTVRLVLAASLLAAPLAYWASQRWLEGFADRIALGPLPFVTAAALVLGLALATVSVHTLRAAMADPVRSLRTD